MIVFRFATTYRSATNYRLDRNLINYMRNSVKVVVDAYDGTTTFYVFDKEDPIIAAYRRIFPSLFKDAAMMPPGLRNHVRYPELLLKLQAEVYGLYHMTDPGAFYNREDLWTVATEVGMSEGGGQTTHTMEPNFVLMISSGRALVYAEPIYLQAARSPMPELRLVVVALQDRVAYGPAFESAMAALFGGAVSSMNPAAVTAEPVQRAPVSAGSPQPAADLNALITEAARDLADYQRLTCRRQARRGGAEA